MARGCAGCLSAGWAAALITAQMLAKSQILVLDTENGQE